MGHLVNPTSLRLGWIKSWENIYFCKNLYYPQLLHLLYKYKLFIYAILRSKSNIRQLGILCSHCIFIHHSRFINTYIYVYHSNLELFIQNFVIYQFEFIRKLIWSYREVQTNLINFSQNVILFFLIHYLSSSRKSKQNVFAYKIWPLAKIKFLIDTFSSNNVFFIKLNLYQFKKLKLNYKNKFIIWFGIFQQFSQKFSNRWDALLHFCYWYACLKGSNLYFNMYTHYFEIFAKFLFKLNVRISWYRLSNDDITPKFLAYYLALKIAQNFTLRQIISPIAQELQKVATNLKLEKPKININLEFKSKLRYKKLLKDCYYNYNKIFFIEYYKFFLVEHTWFLIEHYITLKVNLLRFSLRRKKKIKFLFFLLQNKGWMNLLNNDNFSSCLYIDYNNQIPRFYLTFFQKILIFFNVDYWAILIKVPQKQKSIIEYVANSSIFFQKQLTNCWEQNYSKLIHIFNFNKLKNRFTKRSNNFGLCGFKLHFVGRFSRKQIASSVVCQRGRLPLSSISANIDYDFYSIPVKNSTITVKVWFYYANPIYFSGSKFFEKKYETISK